MRLPCKLPFALFALLFATGCQMPIVARVFNPPVASFHATPNGIPMHRVAVLPVDYDERLAIAPEDLDNIFHAELSKTSAFEVVPISREELKSQYGITNLSSVQVIPRDLLSHLIDEYGVDGILFTDITHYYAYRPVSIGIRCKLVDARSGLQRWVFDHNFDSGNPGIAIAAKQFASDQDSEQLPIDSDGSSILLSPSQFGKYVAHETYRSLLGI